MTTPELLRIRLHNQLLAAHHWTEPADVVSCMGAMQSQALDLAKWGIGVRLAGKTVNDVEEALNTGKIIRTHILRPTWHFVTAEDIHWMSELSAPRLRPVYLSYCKMQGADESLISRVIPALEKILSGGKHLTRQEIGVRLQAEKIMVDELHLKFTISRAEIEGILCNGQLQASKQSFTLLAEWAPRRETLHRDEALERLARRYFTSHGPATLPDFVWWSGLTLTECRRALDMIKHDFICETLNGREFWMRSDIKTPSSTDNSALLLPPFDEFVVSYKDRPEMIPDIHYGKVMTKNGLFSPTVMLNGEIVGSWKKAIKKGLPQLELSFFEKTAPEIQKLFEPEMNRVAHFYSK